MRHVTNHLASYFDWQPSSLLFGLFWTLKHDAELVALRALGLDPAQCFYTDDVIWHIKIDKTIETNLKRVGSFVGIDAPI